MSDGRKSVTRPWQRLEPKRDAFCLKYTERSAAFVDVMLNGYKLLDKDAAIPLERAIAAAKARGEPQPVREIGVGTGYAKAGPGRGHKTSANGTRFQGRGRNNAQDLLRRLARDAPAVLAAYERGEYASVRQAV